jgi:hypothetical protein
MGAVNSGRFVEAMMALLLLPTIHYPLPTFFYFGISGEMLERNSSRNFSISVNLF